jgi:folylpolyglutamate synthase
LGIAGTVQQGNASLAIALVQEHLKRLDVPAPSITPTTLTPEIVAALENARWPGRCETRVEKHLTWYCDGAHTAESIAAATQWYSAMYRLQLSPDLTDSPRAFSKTKILLFNQQTRNATALLRSLVSGANGAKFDKAIFCTNITFKQLRYKDGTAV